MARRPTSTQVRLAIQERLDWEPLTIADIAESLGCSASSVKRACAPGSFSGMLWALRAEQAVRLIVDGTAVAAAAAAVGVSPDHLARIVRRTYGLPPGDLCRVVVLVARVDAWRRRPLPASETRWYREQRRLWLRYQREIVGLLEPIPTDSPLYAWSQRAIASCRRPDYRRTDRRQQLIRQRAQERREQREALQRSIDVATRLAQAA